jgi:hypothetical protein
MLLFEGMKAIVYVWDTSAPIAEEVRSDPFDLFQRVLVVVRSGRGRLGQWQREQRDADADYRRLFEEPPTPIKWLGLESHSEDVKSSSLILFGRIQFERR